MSDYQLLVIGAGPGGYVAALKAAKLGLKTAIVESRDVGGTCLNRGCIPTKALLHTAEVYTQAKEGAFLGVNAEGISVDFAAAQRRKNEVTEKLRLGIEGLFKQKKVDLLRGTGTILAPGKVSVDGNEYTADHILIATGSIPARPPIPGLEHALTSDDLLESEGRMFSSLVIIGGGVIGVELASVYNALGCHVTILEAMDRILPNMDREICQNLTMILKKRGVEIYPSSMVSAVEKMEDGTLSVRYTNKGAENAAQGEAVLCAIGRRANTAGLFGEGFSLDMERGRILTDENFQTSVPGIYAIGDVTAKIQLAHVASAQGTACVEKLAGKAAPADLALIPSCIYTSPEIACIGITADEAKAAGRSVKVGKFVMFANGKTVISNGERGFIKIVADAESGVVLGAQLMCERATDMISQLTTAVANGLTAEQLLAVVRPHPTFEEGIGEALDDLADKLGM